MCGTEEKEGSCRMGGSEVISLTAGRMTEMMQMLTGRALWISVLTFKTSEMLLHITL